MVALIPLCIGFFFVDKQKIEPSLAQNRVHHSLSKQSSTSPDINVSGDFVAADINEYELIHLQKLAEQEEQVRELSFGKKLYYVLSNVDFILFMLGLVGLFFIVTGIQFWVTDYFSTVLGTTQTQAYLIYISVGALGPLMGVIVAGQVFDRIGGYMHKRSLALTVFLVAVGTTAAIFSVMTDGVLFTAGMIWLQLFCGGVVMPVWTGLMIN